MGSQEKKLAQGALKGARDMAAVLGLVRGKDGVARPPETKKKGVAEQQAVKESLRPGEYHVATVTLDNGDVRKFKVKSDEGFTDVIKNFYARQGRKVTNIDMDWSVQGDFYEQSQPGTKIPQKSVMQGYTVFYDPRTKTVSVTRGGDSAEAAIEQARINQPTMLAFRSAVDRMINKIEDDQGLTESTVDDEIEKHLMEMRHAGYDISEGYGSYYCSTKKKMVQRKGPKQSRSSK
jgi:hypothetical protein